MNFKRHEEISQVKMFNPNIIRKQVMLHELYTFYLSFKGL